MQYADKNTIYIQNDEKSENHEFSQIIKTRFWNSWFSTIFEIRKHSNSPSIILPVAARRGGGLRGGAVAPGDHLQGRHYDQAE